MTHVPLFPTIATGALFLGLSSPVTAGLSDQCPLVATLSAQVTALTDYAAPETCPSIRRIAFDMGDRPEGYRSQAGEYVPETDTIYLAEDVDLSEPFGQSVLLHELVHAAQIRAGVDSRRPCRAALEYEAYAMQAQYLSAAGLTAEAGTTRLLGLMLSICPGDGSGHE